MDLPTELLAAVLAGLGAILAGIAGVAASRYRDARLGAVAVAFSLFAVLGGLAVLHEVSPLYGGPFQVDPVPLGVAVAGVSLLYGAFVRNRPEPAAR